MPNSSQMALAWMQDCFSAHSPMATIRPVSSASGMKVDGAITPSFGWCQRSSASMPITRPVVRETRG